MKIYAGNLSYNVSDEDLRAAFAQFGTVDSADVISDRSTGRSKGFGFVEMSDPAEAKAAIEGLNGKDMDGRSLNVNEARPKTDRPQRSFSRY
jgi:RNA recognition motif-containing protein